MFCSVLASAVALGLVLVPIAFLSLGVPQPARDRGFPSPLPPCVRPCWACYTDTPLHRNAQASELEGVKRVRDPKYLIEQLPYCAPSSSDSPSCAGHKLMSPEDVAGICFSFAHLLTARHRELWLLPKPDLLTLAQQLCCTPRGPWLPEGGCSAHRGVCIHFGSWHLQQLL